MAANEPLTESNHGSFRPSPPTRQRVADHVFEMLARAILTGELKPNEPLPTQRDLAKQFSVSALIVRQAIHRLEDLGLVRVRQGSTTIVLDPNESTDIRLIQLQLEISDPGPHLAAAAFEMQVLFAVPLLVLVERRIDAEGIGALTYIVDQIPDDAKPEHMLRYRIEFLRLLAKTAGNQLYLQQVRWWASMVADFERRGGRAIVAPRSGLVVRDFYRRLITALANRSGAAQVWIEGIRPVLDWADAQRGIKKPQP